MRQRSAASRSIRRPRSPGLTLRTVASSACAQPRHGRGWAGACGGGGQQLAGRRHGRNTTADPDRSTAGLRVGTLEADPRPDRRVGKFARLHQPVVARRVRDGRRDRSLSASMTPARRSISQRSYSRTCLELFPFLANARMLRQWAGIADMTPDFSPVMGLTPVENLLHRFGLGHLGFQGDAGVRRDDGRVYRDRSPAGANRTVSAGPVRTLRSRRRARRGLGRPLRAPR